LQNTAQQVKEVAAAVGYDDIPQFSKLFKKKIGVSPQHYRDIIPQSGLLHQSNYKKNRRPSPDKILWRY